MATSMALDSLKDCVESATKWQILFKISSTPANNCPDYLSQVHHAAITPGALVMGTNQGNLQIAQFQIVYNYIYTS